MRYRARITFHFVWMLLITTVVVVAFVRLVGKPSALSGIAMGVLMLGMAGGAARRIAWRLARPIEALAEASRQFGAGRLDTRVDLGTVWPGRWPGLGRRRHRRRPLDELAALGREWNDMAGRIERLVQAQRELLANVSHELRSPLARIRVALELLPRTPEVEARLDEVTADIEELDRLIDDVLTASRLDASPAYRPADVDLGELLAGLRARAAHDPVTAPLEVRVDGDAAGSARGDPALLRRALWNLVENAAKHGAPPIVLCAARAGEWLELSVTDDGDGIPAEELARVQDPFVRLDPARTPGARAGIGLGLTIARRVAEVHGGALRLEAGPGGRGLRATITIPSSDAQTAST